MNICPICGAPADQAPDFIWCESCQTGWELESFYEESDEYDDDCGDGDSHGNYNHISVR